MLSCLSMLCSMALCDLKKALELKPADPVIKDEIRLLQVPCILIALPQHIYVTYYALQKLHVETSTWL
jgi:hypothetical protein